MNIDVTKLRASNDALFERMYGAATPDRPIKRLERGKPHQKYWSETRQREVPGASTIAKIGSDSGGLLYWAWDLGKQGKDYRKERDKAADIGTLAHFMIECEIQGLQPDLSEFPMVDIDAAGVPYYTAVQWWEQQGLTPIAPEMQLVSEEHGYGGTIDMPCRSRDGCLALLDWKTSKAIWPEHIIQVSAYEKLLEEKFKEKVDRRCIVRIGKDGSFEARWLGDLSEYFHVFKAQLALYKAKLSAGLIKK